MGIELFYNSVRNRQRVKGAGFYSSFSLFPVANGSQGFALDESTAILYADIAGVWVDVGGGGVVPSIEDRVQTFEYFNDFFAVIASTSNTANDLFFSGAGTGTATASVAIFANNQIGIISCATGTTATGRASLQTSLASFALGQGATIFEALVSPAPLNVSDGTNRYSFIAGFFDTLAATQLDAIAFIYDTGGVTTGSTAAAYWQTYTASSPSNTFNAGSFVQVPVTVGAWYKLRIEINALGTQALFYVDGVLIATHSTTIPTGFNRALGFGSQIIKNLGTTSRPFYIDYLLVQQVLTVFR